MVGSHLPARLYVTIERIAEIERWWKFTSNRIRADLDKGVWRS